MSQLVRWLPWLLTGFSGPPACGGDDAAGDAGLDVVAEADRVEAAVDADVADRGPDGVEPDDGFGVEHVAEVDDPDEASGGEVEEAAPDVSPGDAGGEVCEPASVGWDEPLVLSPAEFHELLEAGDRVLINVFDDVIPQIAGTDAQLPWTDVPAIEEYLGHDRCADLAIYCRRGVRSTGVCTTLAEHGYRFVRVLEGGIEAWQAAGYPVE
jgi:rhodanese-related sulfurtransferase